MQALDPANIFWTWKSNFPQNEHFICSELFGDIILMLLLKSYVQNFEWKS